MKSALQVDRTAPWSRGALLLALAGALTPALAQHHDKAWHGSFHAGNGFHAAPAPGHVAAHGWGGYAGPGYIAHPGPGWGGHGGAYWNHGWHGGRWGWWWVDAGVWNWYATYPYAYGYYPYYYGYADPYYPPAEATMPATNVPPAVQSWYFCDASNSYYPYVQSCASGWRPVPATPPRAPAAPPAN